MKKLSFLFIFFILIMHHQIQAQEMDLPYKEIPAYPTDYSSGNLVSRMIDGLGYRYYWATEGLTEKDLTYKPSEDGRTILETLEHIHNVDFDITRFSRSHP